MDKRRRMSKIYRLRTNDNSEKLNETRSRLMERLAWLRKEIIVMDWLWSLSLKVFGALTSSETNYLQTCFLKHTV